MNPLGIKKNRRSNAAMVSLKMISSDAEKQRTEQILANSFI
jgi:hypothetical protein